jgi:hypothetical protein
MKFAEYIISGWHTKSKYAYECVPDEISGSSKERQNPRLSAQNKKKIVVVLPV